MGAFFAPFPARPVSIEGDDGKRGVCREVEP
jgi:hypothetical protein